MEWLAELEARYLSHHAALSHSAKTRDHYTDSLRTFHRFLDERGLARTSAAMDAVRWLEEHRLAIPDVMDEVYGLPPLAREEDPAAEWQESDAVARRRQVVNHGALTSLTASRSCAISEVQMHAALLIHAAAAT